MPPPDKPRVTLDTSQPLYVSAVDGKPVARFRLGGRGGGQPAETIGAVREKREGDERPRLYFNTSLVVMIPAAEVAAFRREYERALLDGDLVRRTVQDFDAFHAAAKERAKAAPAVEVPEGNQPPETSGENAPAAPAEGSVS